MRLLVLILSMLCCSLVWAVAPQIELQQKQLKKEQMLWDDVRLPKGVDIKPTAINARESGHRQASLYAKNAYFSYVEDLRFDINHLSAILTPLKEDVPVVMNDISTFKIDILQGDLTLSFKTLEYIFNRHVLNYAERPLKEVKISADENGQMVIDTKMRLKPPYPSTWLSGRIKGQVSLDNQKRISIAVTSMQVFGMPLAWSMELLSLDLDMFINLERPGIALEERSIKIDLSVLPPPQLNGNLSKVVMTSTGLNLGFSSANQISFDAPPIASDSYLWIQSGDVRVADMVILNGNLQVVSSKPEQRVLFNLYDCRKQIAAGFLKILPRGEIVTFLPPDF